MVNARSRVWVRVRFNVCAGGKASVKRGLGLRFGLGLGSALGLRLGLLLVFGLG